MPQLEDVNALRLLAFKSTVNNSDKCRLQLDNFRFGRRDVATSIYGLASTYQSAFNKYLLGRGISEHYLLSMKDH